MAGQWKKATDSNGKVYYYNTVTKESRWDKPVEDTTDLKQKLRDAGWNVAKTKEGKVYYYNVKTKESRWDNPLAEKATEKKTKTGQTKKTTIDQVKNTANTNEDNKGNTVALATTNNTEKYPNTSKILNVKSLTKDEAEKAFMDMLSEHQVDSSWSFHKMVVDLGLKDERFWIVDDDPLWKQNILDKYLSNRSEEQLIKDHAQASKFLEAFGNLLKSNKNIHYYTRWTTVKKMLANESIFKHAVVPEKEMKKKFNDYIRTLREEKDKKDESIKELALREVNEYLRSILIAPPNTIESTIEVKMTWSQLQREYITGNKRFAANKHFRLLSQHDILNQYIELVKIIQGNLASKVSDIEMKNYSRNRMARDQFKVMLKQPKLDIRADSKWSELYPKIKSEKAFLQLVGRNGSSPLDLFYDYTNEKKAAINGYASVAQQILIDNSYVWAGIEDSTRISKNITEFEKANFQNISGIIHKDGKLALLDEKDLQLVVKQAIAVKYDTVKEIEQRNLNMTRIKKNNLVALFHRTFVTKPGRFEDAVAIIQNKPEYKALENEPDIIKQLFSSFVPSKQPQANTQNLSRKRKATALVQMDY